MPPPICLSRPQARSLLSLLQLAELPSTLDRHEKKALTHAKRRLTAGLAREPIHAIDRDLARLEDVLLGIRSASFRGFVHTRIRDLLSTTLVWAAAEELPREVRGQVLDLTRISEGPWMANALDLLGVHGLRVTLPGEGPQ